MTRWINADKLKKLFATECATECAVCSHYNNAAEVDECHCLLIDKATTTQDNRKTAKWIDTGEMEEYWAEEYQCSICGVKNHWHNFCPYCGADMREADNEQ